MDQPICRTCLKANLPQADRTMIFGVTSPKQIPIKDMLEIFMPEMHLDIFEGDLVMCLACSDALRGAYVFKTTCLKTEEAIYEYLHRYNIKFGKKISLSSITEPKAPNDPNKFDEAVDSDGSLTVVDIKPLKLDTPTKTKTSYQERRVKHKRLKRYRVKPVDHSALKRSYTCDLCEYKAYRSDLLTAHKKKHADQLVSTKEYKCEFCTYSTLRKRSLDRHLFTHEKGSQHRCDICSRTFAENYQLKLHALTHSGKELPHKCEECGKGYLTKAYLKQHLETRHLLGDTCVSGRHYKCGWCEASFSDGRGLKAHKILHSGGELPYKCLECNFSTAWKGNLMKHLRNKH